MCRPSIQSMAVSFSASALLLTLAGCGSGTTSPTTTRPAGGSYTLAGTVRDEAGAPIPGATVSAGYNLDVRRPGFGEGATDLQGHYVVSGLFAGPQPIGVSKPGYLTVLDTVAVADGAVKDFTLRAGVNLFGRTLEAGVGPLSGVAITVTSGPDAGVQTTSGLYGGYTLRAVLPGDFTIRAS